jgi:hypothetical protein
MTEDILEIWQRRDEEALARMRSYNERFFGAKVQSRADAEKSARGSQSTIYGRLTSHPSLPEVLRRINDAEISKPEKGEMQQRLYPARKP